MLFGAEYPDSWDDYIGQETAKRELQVSIKSARKRNARLPHLMIVSPYPGVGKTALAQLIVRSMDTEAWTYSGQMKLAAAQMMFTEVKDQNIVFLDEFHRMMDGGKKHIEWMLHYLENGVLLTPYGAEEVPDVTIIGATTDDGILPEPVRDRFKFIRLERYTEDQGRQIAQGMARRILASEGLPEVDEETAFAIARAGNSQPRLMRRLLVSLRDLTLADEITVGPSGRYPLDDALEFSGLTEDGLTTEAQDYLKLLWSYGANPVGEAVLRKRLQVVGNGFYTVERLLLDKELIKETKSGRVMTGPGRRRAKDLLEAAG